MTLRKHIVHDPCIVVQSVCIAVVDWKIEAGFSCEQNDRCSKTSKMPDHNAGRPAVRSFGSGNENVGVYYSKDLPKS